VLGSIAILTWFGYRAVRGWRESATQLAERRATETANLLLTAVARDMRGVQSVVLSSPNADEFMLDAPYDVRAIAAGAFARYPYPESFFAWRGDPSPESVVFFDRAERRPVWAGDVTGSSRFPVVVARYPSIADELIDRIRADAREGRRFSTFEMMQNGVAYHVVVRLHYRDALRERLESVFGFTVNIDWVRRYYFGELTRQVARINGAGQGLLLQVVDDGGRRLLGPPGGEARGPTIGRPFLLRFFDPLTVEGDVPAGRPWRFEVSVGDDPALAAAERGGSRTLFMVDVAAGVLALGALLAFRATRASARLAELRSDFVSTVTHELKTPIASIRAMGETLARDRIADPATRAEYAQTIVQESKRLARLIDNLLAYSRITDVTEVYSFEPVDVHSLVEEILQGFSPQLSQQRFEVHVEIARGLPRVRGDRTALRLMLENVVDNAIRYSGASRWVGVTASADSGRCTIEISDRGIGIPRDDIERVTQRFHRGRNAGSGGSGLGLAIVSRIVSDHGGTLDIESALDRGTSVRVGLAVSEERREEANPRR
jgi:signal transduction histidine kinase